MTVYITDALELTQALYTAADLKLTITPVDADVVGDYIHNDEALSRIWSSTSIHLIAEDLGLHSDDLERVPQTPRLELGDRVFLARRLIVGGLAWSQIDVH